MRFGCLIVASWFLASACGPASQSNRSQSSPPSERDSGGRDAGGGGGGGGGGSSNDGAPVTQGSVGIVVIDVQEAFVDTAKNPDVPGIVARTKNTLELAGAEGLPLFITYEASQSGDHALHAPLTPVVPPQAQSFIKTTFAATGLPQFAQAVQESGLTHLVVLGAETDVCVMQTVLGLRRMGLTVMLEKDAVLSSETNPSPALRRMQQAGTLLVDESEVAGYAGQPSTLPPSSDADVRVLRPLHVGVVLNDFTDAALAQSSDPLVAQKEARLRELLLVSEWFDLPVYVSDGALALPQAYASLFHGPLRPMSQIGQDSGVEQLVFAGTDGGLPSAISSRMDSHETFVVEDALFSLAAPGAQAQMLAPLFADGLVPTTYKSFYYEMTQSVEVSQWPSQSWIAKFDEYYWITQAPEDLPPMPGP